MSCFYYPANESYCKTGWIINKNKPISSGSGGITYEACCETICDYIAKHIYLMPGSELFLKEVHLQQKVARIGLAPKLFDYWPCEHGGMIVMERMTNSLNNIIMNLYETDPILIYYLIKNLISNVFILHSMEVCHNDLHFNNIMLKYKKIEDIRVGEYELKFIDFGESYIIEKRCCDGKLIFEELQGLLQGYTINDKYILGQDKHYGGVSNKGQFYIKLSLLLVYETFEFYPNKPIITKKEYETFGFELPENGYTGGLSKDYVFKLSELSVLNQTSSSSMYPSRRELFEDEYDDQKN